MSKSYAAAIEIIQIALDEHKGTCAVRWVANLQSAIRVLEAAGKVDKNRAEIELTWVPVAHLTSGLPGLVDALPDKEPT